MGFYDNQSAQVVPPTGYHVRSDMATFERGELTPEEATALGQYPLLAIGTDSEGFTGLIPEWSTGIVDRGEVYYFPDGSVRFTGARFTVTIPAGNWMTGGMTASGNAGALVLMNSAPMPPPAPSA